MCRICSSVAQTSRNLARDLWRKIFVKPPERVKMVAYRQTSLLMRARNVFCYLFLILAVFSEAYTVLAIALDQFAPPWYRILGWFLLAAPSALAVGMLLFYANQRRLGFYLSAASLLLYTALVFFDIYQRPKERGDWLFEGAWLGFCGLGILAAKSLMSRPATAPPKAESLFSDGS